MNRWQEKNKDKNFKNNSNANTAFKNTHKYKLQELTMINSDREQRTRGGG